jgi:(2Fe-2S) ferredoxin
VAKFQKHVFICVNERDPSDPKGCCASKGAKDVASAFKQKLHERGLKRVVRANKAMCLDQCAQGVTIVVYPEATWYGHVTVDDVEEIVAQHIVGGKPVERLVLPPEKLTGIDPAKVPHARP